MSLIDLLRETHGDDWFEDIWRDREERVYPALFGPLPSTVIPLTAETFQTILGPDTKVQPQWLHYAVIEIAPNEQHADWLYVTTAFSQPWKVEKPEDLNKDSFSGVGYELVLRTPERAGWAVEVLHRLAAYQIGVNNEILKGKLFEYGDWMALNGPLSNLTPESKVRGIFITRPRDFAARFELQSGQVDVLQIVGITGDEVAFLLNSGPIPLEELLYTQGAAPTSDPERGSVELPRRYELPPQLQARF